MSPFVFAAAVSLMDFAFLEGRWCAAAFGGQVVERWEAPFGDAVTGSMTVVRDGAAAFHEFFLITRHDGRWQLRLKHFNPDMVSWEAQEEVVAFELQSVADGRAEFDGMLLERTGPESLRVELTEGPLLEYRSCVE